MEKTMSDNKHEENKTSNIKIEIWIIIATAIAVTVGLVLDNAGLLAGMMLGVTMYIIILLNNNRQDENKMMNASAGLWMGLALIVGAVYGLSFENAVLFTILSISATIAIVVWLNRRPK